MLKSPSFPPQTVVFKPMGSKVFDIPEHWEDDVDDYDWPGGPKLWYFEGTMGATYGNLKTTGRVVFPAIRPLGMTLDWTWFRDVAQYAPPAGRQLASANDLREWKKAAPQPPAAPEPAAAPANPPRVPRTFATRKASRVTQVAPPDSEEDEAPDSDESEAGSQDGDRHEAPLPSDFVDGEGRAPRPLPWVQAGAGRAGLPRFRGWTPWQIFEWLATPAVKVAHRETNRVSSNPLEEDTPISETDFWLYVACKIFFLILPLRVTKRYWSPGNLSKVGVKWRDMGEILSRRKYDLIIKCLRFADYSLRGGPDVDKAWKVRPLFVAVKEQFNKLLPAPGQYISIDEGMVLCTTKLNPLRRTLPNKPVPTGHKFYMAVCKATGVLFDFNISDGNETAASQAGHPGGYTGFQVWELIKNLPGQGYIVVVDNYYASIGLAHHLKENGHGLIGTLRRSRAPRTIPFGPAKKPRPPYTHAGHTWLRNNFKVMHDPDSRIWVYCWMDNVPAYFIDTVYGPTVKADVKRRFPNGQQVTYNAPKVVETFNSNMAGVDAFDSRRAGSFSVEGSHRSDKWTHKFWDGMLSFLLCNAYIVWSQGRDYREDDHFSFLVDLYSGLCEAKLPTQVGKRRAAARGHLGDSSDDDSQSDAIDHPLRQTEQESGPDGKRYMGRCKNCPDTDPAGKKIQRRTTFNCATCRVFLHPHCHAEYHKRLRDGDVDPPIPHIHFVPKARAAAGGGDDEDD